MRNKNTCLHCPELQCDVRKECPDEERKPH